jgi:hypothetical protein
MLLKYSCFKNKFIGIGFCTAGILLTKLNSFYYIKGVFAETLYFLGVFIAILGIATFTAGIKTTTAKVFICPSCYCTNSTTDGVCKKCKLPLKQINTAT